MKRNFLFTSSLLFSLLGANAANITVEYIDGDRDAPLEGVTKIDLTDDYGFIEFYGANDEYIDWNYASFIQKLILDGETSTKSEIVEAEKLKIYPNPANDVVYIEGAEKGATISLFNIAGKELTKKVASEETNEVNVSSLANGTYLLRVGKNIVKVVKSK